MSYTRPNLTDAEEPAVTRIAVWSVEGGDYPGGVEQLMADVCRLQDAYYTLHRHIDWLERDAFKPMARAALLQDRSRADRPADASCLRLANLMDRYETEAEVHRSDLAGKDAEIERLRAALEIIAGRRQCVDNLMSNVEVAVAALDHSE